jgi:CubicO group peptidase (beta-lactamase class C family)
MQLRVLQPAGAAIARRRLRGLLLAVALLAPPGAAAGGAPGSSAGDAADVGPFLDGLIEGLMATRHVPGAVAIVVKDGAVVYQRGYGFADPRARRPVDPETTLFRVASISKLFTATAVMQLVEQQKLDLDADVNRHLSGLQVPPAFGAPVTLRHLLTHTAGFDDSFLESAEPLEASPEPLADYLARRLPPRVMPPGELLSYSNHGIALAGLVVEQVSGRPFAEYVRDEILLPLGMTHSGFGLPSPPPEALAVGHLRHGDIDRPAGVDRIHWAPAGDFYTSAPELARFALAHLAEGRIPGSGARILRAETARVMQARAFTHRPEQRGWCLGFAERGWNGVRAIGHSGDWRGFGSDLVLVPTAGLGVFVSTTRGFDTRFFEALWRAFFDRYFPAPAAPLVASPESKPRAREVAGAYIPNRHVRGDVLKLGLLLGTLRVAAQDDGSIELRYTSGERDPIRAVEVGTGLWRSDSSEDLISFQRDARGTQHALVDAWAFDRVPWWRDPERHKLAFGGCALLFAATLAGYALAGLVRILWGGPASGSPLAARFLAAGVSALSLAVLGVLAYGLTRLSPHVLLEGIPPWLRAAGWLPLLSIPLSLALPWLLWRSRRSPEWTPLARLHFALLTLASAVFALLAWSYHLIGLAWAG